jgi:hypothetical protein
VDRLLDTWGYNADGELGDNSISVRSSPVPIGTSFWFVASAGGGTTAALQY